MRRTAVVSILIVLFILCFSTVGLAKEPSTQELTLQEAVERALELSKTLKIAEKEKEKAREQREEAQEEVSYTPTGMVNPEIEAAYASLLQAELNYQIKRKSYLSLLDDIKQQVVEKYCNVLSASAALEKARKAFEQADWEKKASQLKLQVGTMAPVAMAAVNASYEQALGALVQAEQDLNKAYVELNALVGFWPEDRPQLVTDVEYGKLDIVSITSEVNRAISNSTDVWSALQSVIIERQDLRMALKPYDIEKIEIEIAELTADQAKDELEKQLLLLYHDIVSLEGGMEAAKESVAAAEEALRAARVRFDVGTAVEGDLLEAEANLAAAKSSLASLKYSHGKAVAVYRNLTGRDVLPPQLAEDTGEQVI